MFKGHAIYHLIYIIASQLYMHWRQETENAGCPEYFTKHDLWQNTAWIHISSERQLNHPTFTVVFYFINLPRRMPPGNRDAITNINW